MIDDTTYRCCGDGFMVGSETCDDGNKVSGDGCTAACTLEYCGDGVLQPALGEVCEPLLSHWSQCSDSCTPIFSPCYDPYQPCC